MHWGDKLEFVAEAGPGDCVYMPPYVPHQEINASSDEVLERVLVRSDGEALAINLDIEPVEKPETCFGSIRSTGLRAERGLGRPVEDRHAFVLVDRDHANAGMHCRIAHTNASHDRDAHIEPNNGYAVFTLCTKRGRRTADDRPGDEFSASIDRMWAKRRGMAFRTDVARARIERAAGVALQDVDG